MTDKKRLIKKTKTAEYLRDELQHTDDEYIQALHKELSEMTDKISEMELTLRNCQHIIGLCKALK